MNHKGTRMVKLKEINMDYELEKIGLIFSRCAIQNCLQQK